MIRYTKMISDYLIFHENLILMAVIFILCVSKNDNLERGATAGGKESEYVSNVEMKVTSVEVLW
jgi:hypothetical protein